jgi:DNA-binding GntR family transcriptional regulator
MKSPDGSSVFLNSSHDAPLSKEDYVYGSLKETILSGKLAPGDVLIQTDIARSMNVSSIPVRTAINRLAAEGLITQERHCPPRVTELSIDQLDEILIIRMHLEVLATRESAGRVNDELFDQLNTIIAESEKAISEGDFVQYGLLNKRFHLTIYEACPFPMLTQLIKDLWNNSDRFRSRTMFVFLPDQAAISHQEHVKLLDSLRKGDSYQAAVVMETHKSRARESFLRHLRSLHQTAA